MVETDLRSPVQAQAPEEPVFVPLQHRQGRHLLQARAAPDLGPGGHPGPAKPSTIQGGQRRGRVRARRGQ